MCSPGLSSAFRKTQTCTATLIFSYNLYQIHWLSISNISTEILWIKSTWSTIFLSMFISFLYMFRATVCPSSGETTLFTWHLVLVILYGWLSGMQGGTKTIKGCMVNKTLNSTENVREHCIILYHFTAIFKCPSILSELLPGDTNITVQDTGECNSLSDSRPGYWIGHSRLKKKCLIRRPHVC